MKRRSSFAYSYTYKAEQLALLEAFAHQGNIDLYYGDESHVCSEGCVPYGWQFPDEEVYIASERSIKINCFGLSAETISIMVLAVTHP